MSLMKNKKSVIAAFVAGALVFVIFGSITLKTEPRRTDEAPGFQYVVLKGDIKKGDFIKEENVEIKKFNVNIEGAYKTTGEVIGRSAQTDISAGKPLITAFLASLDNKANAAKGTEPVCGFRAVPILIRKSALPPYIKQDARYDLFTRENSMKIENLRILNMLDLSEDAENKMLILEIRNKDVQTFIDYQTKTKGFIFVRKNPEEIGSYAFSDIAKTGGGGNTPSYNTNTSPAWNQIPAIEDYGETQGFVNSSSGNQVEVIVGNKKSTVEF